METKNYKAINGIAITAIAICAIQITWLILQSWFISGINGSTCEIAWDNNILPFQLTLFIGRVLFGVAYNAIIIVFLIKSVNALKKGTLFIRSNVTLLYMTAGCYIINRLCDDNMGNILMSAELGNSYFAIESGSILITLLFIIFALLYRIAAEVSEDNNLTI